MVTDAHPTTTDILAGYDRHVMKTYGRVPLAFVRGEGAYLWDAEGRRYLDLVAGGRAGGALGHRHPRVTAALHEQLDTLVYISNDFHHPWAARLAQMLAERTNGFQSFFCNSGAEANEAAVKLARKVQHDRGTGRHEVITALRSFHGRTLGMIAATGQEKVQHGFEPLTPGFRYVPFNDLAALEAAIGPETGAIMLEPVQGEIGTYPATPEYLRAARALCDRHGLLLLLDEVQTGFGRTGRFWAYEHAGILPDIVTLAKAVGGGPPLGVCLARPEVAAHFGPGTHGCTFGGNPLATAGGIAALEALEADGCIENAATLGAQFLEGLSRLLDRSPHVVEVRGLGMMLALELRAPHGATVWQALMDCGVLVHAVGDTTLRILPPLILTRAQVEEAVAAITETVLALP